MVKCLSPLNDLRAGQGLTLHGALITRGQVNAGLCSAHADELRAGQCLTWPDGVHGKRPALNPKMKHIEDIGKPTTRSTLCPLLSFLFCCALMPMSMTKSHISLPLRLATVFGVGEYKL